MKKTFKIVASLLLVLVTSTFVFAQVSNTFSATGGTLRDDADNFMDVRYFNDVDFSNFFATTRLSFDYANLGFAKKFNDLYLGAYYAGLLWNAFEITENEQISTGEIATYNKTVTGDHEFDLLLGFSGMAFKLDTMFYFDNNVVMVGDTSKTTTKNSFSDFALTWGGLSIPAGNANLRPWATLGFQMNDRAVVQEYNIDGEITINTDKTDSRNHFLMTLASDIEWGDKDGFFSVAGLGYTLYTAVGLNDVVNETNNADDPKLLRVGAKDSSSIIDSYYRFEYTASDKVKFGGRVWVSFNFNTYCDGDTYYSGDDVPHVDDFTVTSTTMIYSGLGFGMQYKLKPEFAMNLGFYATLPTFESEKNVNKTLDSMSVTSGVYSDFNPYLMAGFVWDINENCALDASMSLMLEPRFWSDVLDGQLSLGFKYKI